MSFFNQDYLDFFTELDQNNHKEWFDANRKRYEKSVKKPFENFVRRMIELVQTDDKTVVVEPKNCMFRINRDIRFSKDKTPYKTNRSAAISRNGRKEMGIPGLYFHFGHKSIGIYGGCYMPDKEMLADIRYQIANDLEGFEAAISDKNFQKMWGTVHGKKNKVIPKDLKEIAEKLPLIYNKQFYYGVELPAENVLRKDLDAYIFEHHMAAKPLRVWLTKAIGAWVA